MHLKTNAMSVLLMLFWCCSAAAQQLSNGDMTKQISPMMDAMNKQIAELEAKITNAQQKNDTKTVQALQQQLDMLKNAMSMTQRSIQRIQSSPGQGAPLSTTKIENSPADSGKANPLETYDSRIASAVVSGKLSKEQAWRYRLAARFKPNDVPSEFRPRSPEAGAPEHETIGADGFLNSLAMDLPNLSQRAQEDFIGYFVPPIYPGSKLPGSEYARRNSSNIPPHATFKSVGHFQLVSSTTTPQPTQKPPFQGAPDTAPTPYPMGFCGTIGCFEKWTFLSSNDLKVWWRTDADPNWPGLNVAFQKLCEHVARDLLALFPAVKPKLDAVMGRTVMSDAGIKHTVPIVDKSGNNVVGHEDVLMDGGDGKLDIYLSYIFPTLSGEHAGFTVPYPPGCTTKPSTGTPSFVVINPVFAADTSDKMKSVLAHEYFHVLQNTFTHALPCGAYVEVEESTANWAAMYTFPEIEWIRSHFTIFFQYGSVSMLYKDDPYETWPFYSFTEHTLGTKVNRQIFVNFALQDQWDSVNSALPGGFEKQFPEYTVREWNQSGAVDDFRTWQIWNLIPLEGQVWRGKPVEEIRVKADVSGSFRVNRDLDLSPLTRKYFHFTFDDPNIHSVGFETVMAFDPNHVGKLKALVKHLGGSFKVEDWSSTKDVVEFCQDEPKENVEEVVLAFSNIDDHPPGGGGHNFQNSISVEATNLACKSWVGKFTGDATRDDSCCHDHMQTKVQAEFERAGVDSSKKFRGRFNALGGTGNYDYEGLRNSGKGQPCRGTAAGGFEIKGGAGNGFALNPYHVGTNNDREYMGTLYQFEPSFIAVTYHCPDGSSVSDSVALTPIQWGFMFDRRKADASGNLVGSGSVGNVKMTWDVRPKH